MQLRLEIESSGIPNRALISDLYRGGVGCVCVGVGVPLAKAMTKPRNHRCMRCRARAQIHYRFRIGLFFHPFEIDSAIPGFRRRIWSMVYFPTGETISACCKWIYRQASASEYFADNAPVNVVYKNLRNNISWQRYWLHLGSHLGRGGHGDRLRYLGSRD